MRQIGTLPEAQARPFADYLLTLGITTRLDCSPEGCAVWVHREEHLDRAREELRAFEQAPDDSRFHNAQAQAEAIRRRQAQIEREHARRTVDLRGRLDRTGLGPLTRALLFTSIAVFVLQWTNVSIAGRPVTYWLYFSDWSVSPEGTLVNRGIQPILEGQVWRLITPIFAHGGIIHIFFNMYMLVMLGGAIERRRRLGEYALLVLLTAVVSNVAQFYLPDVFTIPGRRLGGGPFLGMSGVIYGLFGYAWMRGRFDPGSGLRLHPQTVMILLIWLVICALNLIPIANTAHVVGMLTGMAFAFATLWRDGFRW